MMTETARELKKGMDDMMIVCKRKFGEMVFDGDVDTELVEFMRGMFNMCDLSMKLVEEQAQTIEAMNDKLDKLLARP